MNYENLTFAERQKEVELIRQRLLCPFHMSALEVKPGAFIPGKGAVPFVHVTPRAVEKRLMDVLGFGNYSISDSSFLFEEEILEKKIKNSDEFKEKRGLLVGSSCKIEIHHPLISAVFSNVGEKSVDTAMDNKVTSAWAQAFKRAASTFGVGSYLYYLDIPPQSYDYKTGFQKTIKDFLTNELMEKALHEVGFKSKCELTGISVPWIVAAESLNRLGRILSAEEAKKLLGK